MRTTFFAFAPNLGHPRETKRDAPSAFAWMAAGAALFGLMSFFARVSSAHAHWTVTASVRAAIGALVALGAALVQKKPPFMPQTRMLWQRTAFGTVSIACTFYALSDSRAALADVVTLANMTPIFIALLAPIFLGERGGRRVGIAVPLAAVGVVLVLRPPFLFGDPLHASRVCAIVPETVAVFGGLFSAFAILSLRRVSQGETAEAIVVHFSLTTATVLGLVALAVAPLPDRGAILPLIATGVCAGFAQIAMTQAYSLARAARVGAMGTLAIVVSAAMGAIVLHEPLSPYATLGMAMVIAGGLVIGGAGVREKRLRQG